MQGTHARVAAPGENQLASAAGTDQLVIDQVRRHTHQRQVFLALTNDFMTRRRGDQVGEAFERNGIAVVHETLYRVGQGEHFSHGVGLPMWIEKGAEVAPKCIED